MSMFTAGARYGDRVQKAGGGLIFFSLVVIYFWFGGMKFTAYEAEGLVPMVSNSPLLSWTYDSFSQRGFAAFLGVLELIIGLLIAGRLLSPKLSVVGGALSAGLFFVTLSLMLSTPKVIEPSLGFPAISVSPGQFLLKDIGLFAASLWVVGESLAAINTRRLHDG